MSSFLYSSRYVFENHSAHFGLTLEVVLALSRQVPSQRSETVYFGCLSVSVGRFK